LAVFEYAGADVSWGIEDEDRVALDKRVVESEAQTLLFEAGAVKIYELDRR
jgi:hypothetical protein